MNSVTPNLRASHEIPTGVCQCGCGQKTRLAPYSDRNLGWVKGEPLRYLNGHYRPPRQHSGPDYTIEDCGYSTPCWIWAGKRNADGYAIVVSQRKVRRIHVVYYEQKHGPVPDGLILDHRCRNRGCVNPDHMEPVTWRENVLRGIGPTAVNARKEFCVHGHRFDEVNTYIRPDGTRDCKQCIKRRSREAKRRSRAAGRA